MAPPSGSAKVPVILYLTSTSLALHVPPPDLQLPCMTVYLTCMGLRVPCLRLHMGCMSCVGGMGAGCLGVAARRGRQREVRPEPLLKLIHVSASPRHLLVQEATGDGALGTPVARPRPQHCQGPRNP